MADVAGHREAVLPFKPRDTARPACCRDYRGAEPPLTASSGTGNPVQSLERHSRSELLRSWGPQLEITETRASSVLATWASSYTGLATVEATKT